MVIKLKIDDKLIKDIAYLANIKLDFNEFDVYKSNFSKIINYFQQISDINDNLDPNWSHDIQGTATYERDDDIKPSYDIKEILKNAPKKTGTAYQIPRIIEK